MKRTLLTTLALGFTLAAGAASAQAPGITRYRGTIETLLPASATIKLRDGKLLTVDLIGTKVVAVTKSDLSEITPDSYIGTASVPQPDGTAKALEVSVFDKSLRGTGDGSYPWDQPGSTMTNGAVGALVGSTGRTMTVQYKGGEKKIEVPTDVPIVHLAPADMTKVMVGSHVIAFTVKGEGEAAPKAVFLLSGQDGTVPPM